MSSPPDDHFHTAKSISIQKLEHPACCLDPAHCDCSEWARDLNTHITRIMANTTPHDRTMPPTSPQTKIQAETPRPSFSITKAQAIVHDSSAAACTRTRTPRPPRNVARDGLYHAFKRSASYPPRADLTSTCPQPRKNFCPSGFDSLSKRVQQVYYKPAMQLESKSNSTLEKDKPNTTVPEIHSPQVQAFHAQTMRHDEQEILTAIASCKARPTPPATPLPKLKLKLNPTPLSKPLQWANTLRGKRRTTDIFNISFNFTSPSRRSAEDHTPPISPRTSFSFPSSSPYSSTHPTTPSWKRQKRNSTCPSTLTDTCASPLILTSPPFVSTHTEAHPGVRVSFESETRCDEDGEEEEEEYHKWLGESRRWSLSSSSDGDVVPLDIADDFTYGYAYNANTGDTSSRVLGLGSDSKSFTRVEHESLLPSPWSSSPSSWSASTTDTDVSTPRSPSADRFLSHVRASQEARALMKTPRNFVWVDEVEGEEWGWGGPL
jgi:hypothetical protein